MLTTSKSSKVVARKMNNLLRDSEFDKWADKNGLFQTRDTESEDYWCNVIHQDMEEFYKTW